MKILADDDLGALLSVVGVHDAAEPLNVELTASTMKADLLARTSAGIVHVEFVKDPAPDLGRRMLDYWTRVRYRHRDDPITQYVLVLGDDVPVPGRWIDGGVSCTWSVVRVSELDPATLLATPTTAAIAALARGTTMQRVAALAAAAERIGSGTGPDRSTVLLSAAATLASIVLPGRIIDTTLKEAIMPVPVRDTPLGREIYEQGRGEGRQEGRQEGRLEMLRLMLRQRFGSDPRIEAVAERLAALPDAECVNRLTSATALDDLDR